MFFTIACYSCCEKPDTILFRYKVHIVSADSKLLSGKLRHTTVKARRVPKNFLK